MENLLQKDPDINLVYTINEPAAAGAYEALKAAGKEKDVTIVSVDGGCPGVENVKQGVIGATSQQYPLKMAEMGVQAVVDFAKDGTKPEATAGQGLRRHRRHADHRRAGRRRRVRGHGVRPRELLGLGRHVESVPEARPGAAGRRDGRDRRGRAAGHARHPRSTTSCTRNATLGPLFVLVLAVIIFSLDRRPVPAAGQPLADRPAGDGRRHPGHRPDADHPHGRHRPVGRRDHGALVDRDGQAVGRPGRAGPARAAHRLRRRAPRAACSTGCSSRGCGCRRSSSRSAR